jgi:AbiV family abortive infection protein
MARRRGRVDWPDDVTERKRLAALYGVAAAENAMALLEQATILAEVVVLEESEDDEAFEDTYDESNPFDDDSLEDEEERESEDDLREEMGLEGRADAFFGGHAHARAFALTVFATEEIAKAYAAHLVLSLHDDQDPSAWEAFWDIIGDHKDKLKAALALEQVLPRLAGRHDGLSQSLRDVANGDVFAHRNRALYVDVRDGTVRTPDELAKDSEVARLREALGKSMVAWAIILEGSLKKQLEGFFGDNPT